MLWLDTALEFSGEALSAWLKAKKVAPRRFQSSVKPEHSQRVEAFQHFTQRTFGTDRDQIPKGMIEVMR